MSDLSKLKKLQGELAGLENGYKAKKKELTALKAEKNPNDANRIKTLAQSLKSYPAIIATKKKAIAILKQQVKSGTSKATTQDESKTKVKKQSKPNKAGRPRLKGVQPTYTHGKNMYISLDIHSYNLTERPDGKGIKSIKDTIKNYPKINFTLYVFEKDKEKIPDLIKLFPNPNISYGLHLDPKATDPLAKIDRFYQYIKGIQPSSRTPTSVHVGGKYSSEILKKLKSKHIPFVRSANNTAVNTVATENTPAVKNVIAASAKKKVIKAFKTDEGTKNYDSYYTHPHQAKDKEVKEILKHFNDGVK